MDLPDAIDAPVATRVPLALVALVLGVGAVLLASALAWGLVQWFGPALPPGVAWWAALAAAAGVLAAGLPLGWLVFKLARDAEPAGSSAAPAVGMERPQFMSQAEREWARARRYGTGAALLLVDVDRYARVSEARGVEAGNAVLADLLRQTAPTLRTADVLTRFAPSQMAIFLAHADATGALDVAERIRERAEQMEVPWQPQRLRVTVSVGVAHLRPAHQNLQSLVDDAEDAAAAARQAGGNCVRAAPLDSGRLRSLGGWRDERRARPKQGGQG